MREPDEESKKLSTYAVRRLIDAAERHWEERQPSTGKVEFEFRGQPYEASQSSRKLIVTRSGERVASRYL